MRICSLGSGSKGNCTYINVEGKGILIDNGLSCRELANRMSDIGLDMSDIKHILIMLIPSVLKQFPASLAMSTIVATMKITKMDFILEMFISSLFAPLTMQLIPLVIG